jgi:hypothetical protein
MSDPNRAEWLGPTAAWLSALSTLIYFLASHSLSNHLRFVIDTGRKFAAIILH